MKVAIHQPQYLPWLPYFTKIEESDLFILLDSVDFQKNGLQNRNQIKTPQGAHWLTVPVRQQLGQKIVDTRIDNSADWRRKHWQTLCQCYGKAAAFETYKKDMQAWFDGEWSSLSDLNTEIIATMMRWMDVRTPILKSSQMTAGGSASELVLNLCLEVQATQYLSGVGGKNYLDEDAFRQAGVEIVYRAAVLPTAYPQLSPKAGFINHLSALDLLLNCGDSWKSYLPEEERGS
ncbi:hypothetical protein BJN45_04890 [Azonexus hydrophilus]|jgi:hypothetical protein|uniref:WbqC family protein n=1 Tax=Azonexus hydrophilus TaxID=418702 RepID=A0A1R1I7B6_9RHOO|nr:WbqC family protein [Azonexus hydrophilus]OMG54567.1 hypothetical protein BJN45_04890 [Azonexus hydrophilus]